MGTDRQTDRRTDGQTEVTTITLRPKRPRVKKNPSRTVDATERTPFSKSRPNDLEDIGQGQGSSHMTHPLMLLIICTKYGKNPSSTVDATERTRNAGRTDRVKPIYPQQLRCVGGYNYQGCTKLKSAWGLNFNINFQPDFHAFLMLSGKAQNVHFILSNTYNIGLKWELIFFTTLKWIRKLSFDDHYEQWVLLIALGTQQNDLIEESWKKEQNPGCWLRKKLQVMNN